MTLEIESHFGDFLLSGPEISRRKLEVQLARVCREGLGDRDSLLAALERDGWQPTEPGAPPQYRYDLDVGTLFVVKY